MFNTILINIPGDFIVYLYRIIFLYMCKTEEAKIIRYIMKKITNKNKDVVSDKYCFLKIFSSFTEIHLVYNLV